MRLGLRVTMACVIALAAALPAACDRSAPSGVRMIVLGFDGMDYSLTSNLMAQGLLPNLSKLASSGGFSPLATSIPPQSPVAWSNFITGLDPGGHGIFDFVHRDPATRLPYLSTARTLPAEWVVKLGKYQLPLSSGRVELLRGGQPFWDALERRGVRTTIVRMPANFPPSGLAHRELSGMGTPDLLGTYGTYAFYTSEPFAFRGRTLSGLLHRVDVRDHVVHADIVGPENPFLAVPTKLEAGLTVYLDPARPVARIVTGGEERMLQVGEWSGWVPVTFSMAPFQELRGMCRFYLKQIRPHFELYVSPINIDPFDPALPIATPASFSSELARATGRFYTQGMPEDTKALEEGALTRDEFLAQAALAQAEVRRQFRHVLGGFDGGLLFYYVGNLDQVSHMMWRTIDPAHPAYDAAADRPYRHVIRDLYIDLDAMVGEALARVDGNTTLVVMSDHGFTSWRRAFHLNSWLRDEGYLTLADPSRPDDPGYFGNVDWSRTRAYGVGLNGLYLNLQRRESQGIVPAADRERLLDDISARLLGVIDPATGSPAVTRVYRTSEVFTSGQHADIAPDLLVGYARGVRCSNESALGGVPPGILSDNTSMWSGDHCMDHDVVPGVLLTNRKLRTRAPSLERLAGALLAEFGIDGFPSR